MNIFIFIIILIALFFSLTIIYFLNKSTKSLSVSEVNNNIFKLQLNEISKDLKMGIIKQEEYDLLKNELSRRILKYSLKNNLESKQGGKVEIYFFKLISVPIIIISSIIFYYSNGQPSLPDLSLSFREANGVPEVFYQRAIINIDKQIINSKDSIELYILKANTLKALNKNDQALIVWEFIIANFPGKIDAITFLSYGETIIQGAINKENKIIISGVAKEVFENAVKLSSVENEVGALARFYIGLHAYQNENLLLANSIWDFIIESAPNEAPWKKQLEEQINQFSNNKTNIQEQDIKSMVERLDKRLYDSDSRDVIQWQKLGRSYLVLGKIDDANKAYQKAYNLDVSNIDSAKGLAESMLLSQKNNNNVNNNIILLFENILSKEENYPLALWVIAEHEIILNNYKRAKKLLNRLLIQLSEDSEEYNLVLNKIKEINN
jgi:cytochrome c-type biogenesis protein CcmI